MAYNEKLADRVREIIAASEKDVEEKKMFGGLCFMVNDKMCIGVRNNSLMMRIGPDNYEQALEKPGCRPMEFTGTVMKGFVYVDEESLNTKKKLETWMTLALQFNKIAKVSKKRNPVQKKL